MRLFFGVFAFFMSCQLVFGQLDSLKLPHAVDSAALKLNSLQARMSARLDSLSNPLEVSLKSYTHSDTLASLNVKLDSIQASVNAKVDSLTHSYTAALTKIQTSAQRYQAKIDSLQTLNLPTEKYQAKMDSLSNKLAGLQQDLSKRIDGIKQNATAKIKSIPFPPELEDKVNKLTNSVGNLSPKTIEAKLPANLGLSKLSGLKNPVSLDALGSMKGIDVPNLPNAKGIGENVSIPDLSGGLNDIKRVGDVSNITSKGEAIQGKVEEAAKDLNPNSIDKLADAKALQLKEVQALQDHDMELPLDPTASEEEMKAKLKEEAQKIAIDHFADKQQQLKAAMSKISKYKTKFPSASSITEVTKRPPNAMRNKPFIERIIPGVGLQMQTKGEDFLLDINPYLGYRFTGRITAGPGWNQRVAYNFDQTIFNPNATIFGPRLFGEFKLGKGFSPRLEAEIMNTKVPPSTITPSVDPSARQWVWGAFVGMKKEYKLIKRVRGTASVMTRLFNPDHKSPYAEVLNVRLGFEFPMKKKRGKVAN